MNRWFRQYQWIMVFGSCKRHYEYRAAKTHQGSYEMTLGTILLIILVLMLVGVIPVWPHSRAGVTVPAVALV